MIKIILLLVILFSCGKKQSSAKKQKEEFDQDGLFYGRIYPMNRSGVTGHIKINKVSDSLAATVKLNGVASGSHEQFLYENNGCPAADPNGDGTIDVSEVSTQSGAKIIEFIEGLQESSYHVMLAAVGKGMIDFEKRTLIVFKGFLPIGCAELEKVLDEPVEPEITPSTQPRPRPRPQVEPEPEVEPPAAPEVEEPSTWWDRLSDRLRSWWCRVRGRCSY